MNTTRSIKSFVMCHGSGEAKGAGLESACHKGGSHKVRMVSMMLLAAAMSSAVLANAVEPLKPTGDSGIEVLTKQNAWTNGEIKNIDSEMGKLTIKHGPLVNLHMPAMTMLFKVNKASLCDGLKIGDKVRFVAESIQGSLVITALTKQP